MTQITEMADDLNRARLRIFDLESRIAQVMAIPTERRDENGIVAESDFESGYRLALGMVHGVLAVEGK